MTEMRQPPYNVVSWGTLSTSDLLFRFADYLEDCDEGHEYRELIHDARTVDLADDRAVFILDELMDALAEFAPDGYYFGTSLGDGTLYGYWEDE